MHKIKIGKIYESLYPKRNSSCSNKRHPLKCRAVERKNKVFIVFKVFFNNKLSI